MIKARCGLIVPVRRRLNHADFRAPVGSAIGAAALVHINWRSRVLLGQHRRFVDET